MTTDQIAALQKGQKLYWAYLYKDEAKVLESTYLGRTKAGKLRLQGLLTVHSEREEAVQNNYYLTRREAAEVLVGEATAALGEVQQALAAAQKLLSAAT